MRRAGEGRTLWSFPPKLGAAHGTYYEVQLDRELRNRIMHEGGSLIVESKVGPNGTVDCIVHRDTDTGEITSLLFRMDPRYPSLRFSLGSNEYLLSGAESAGRKLHIPPGVNLRHVLRRVYSKRTAERIFDQVLADMQEEWAEAMLAGDDRHARWICLRGYAALLLSSVAHAVASIGAKVWDIFRVI